MVLQGPNVGNQPQTVASLKICHKVKYLGTWLGRATNMEHFYGPLAKV